MSDDLFPSGPWTGFYNYSPKDKHRMDLDLTFAAGKLSGDGDDDIGRFMLHGQYDPKSLECSWTKTYVGSHDVFYRGFREGKGIWGTWEISLLAHGGFHIWPKRAGGGETETAAAEQAIPKEAVASEPVVVEKNEQTPPPASAARWMFSHRIQKDWKAKFKLRKAGGAR